MNRTTLSTLHVCATHNENEAHFCSFTVLLSFHNSLLFHYLQLDCRLVLDKNWILIPSLRFESSLTGQYSFGGGFSQVKRCPSISVSDRWLSTMLQ